VDEAHARLIANHQIFIGMTEAMLRQAFRYPILGVITPSQRNTTVTSNGVEVQEVYSGMYVYLTNGIVTAYQLVQ
jgi:hypothetical protein